MRAAVAATAFAIAGCYYSPAPRTSIDHSRRVAEYQAQLDKQAADKKERQAEKQRMVAERREARDKHKAEVLALAAEAHRDRVVFDQSLRSAIDSLIDGAITLADLKNVVIESGTEDEDFVAIQAIGKDSALFSDGEAGPVVLIKNYGEPIIEGAGITHLRNRYFVIDGITSYRTLLGRRQAIVVETAW